MQAPKSVRRPSNWQDFETLCSRLWGEIWRCDDIAKHGRQGQDQKGVDIYGVPEGRTAYWGIQCKGKSEYNDDLYRHPQFTEKEIDKEIQKATTFTPALERFYFATTAVRDASTQEYVRCKNIEHLKKGGFSISIFFWEDIVELIDQNKRTHDWYVDLVSYRLDRRAELTFADGSLQLNAKPQFLRINTKYIQKIMPSDSASQIFALQQTLSVHA